MVDLKSEEILTCFMLIIVGYYIAKIFSRRCNGFRVGGQPKLDESSFLCNLKRSLNCCPTCTNQHFRKYNMDNTATNSCNDINTQFKNSNQGDKIDICIGAYSDNQNIKCTWNDYNNKCVQCFT